MGERFRFGIVQTKKREREGARERDSGGERKRA